MPTFYPLFFYVKFCTACLDCKWYGETYCKGDTVEDLYRWWFQVKVNVVNVSTKPRRTMVIREAAKKVIFLVARLLRPYPPPPTLELSGHRNIFLVKN